MPTIFGMKGEGAKDEKLIYRVHIAKQKQYCDADHAFELEHLINDLVNGRGKRAKPEEISITLIRVPAAPETPLWRDEESGEPETGAEPDSSEAPFQLANLHPKTTGLPFAVWISCQGGANAHVKASGNAKAPPDQMLTITVEPEIRSVDVPLNTLFVDGQAVVDEFEKLRKWIERNRSTLLAYWAGEVDTADALNSLEPIEPEPKTE